MEQPAIMLNEKKRGFKPIVEEDVFQIVCPCGCGWVLPIEYTPSSDDISEFGNKIWQVLIGEKGLSGAIEFLHENGEMA
jgi:hypothetical protein